MSRNKCLKSPQTIVKQGLKGHKYTKVITKNVWLNKASVKKKEGIKCPPLLLS